MSLFGLKLIGVLSLPFLAYFFYRLNGKRRLKHLWKLADQTSLSEAEEELLKEKFHPYLFLNPTEQKELKRKIKFFLLTKNVNPVGEFLISEEMKLLVAAEACLLVTNISSEVFPGLTNIYLVEDTFIKKDNPINPRTGLLSDVPKLGEAWKGGPIVLSWAAVKDGLMHPHGRNNVVFHEFSHNLDQQDGNFDGTPALDKSGNYKQWSDVMGKEFFALKKSIGSRHNSDIDSYGATNEAEFFAVLTEYYFNRPKLLQGKHPEIYDLYNQYFKMNPVRWDQ